MLHVSRARPQRRHRHRLQHTLGMTHACLLTLQVKRVVTGSDGGPSCLVHGVVCRKNVAHRRMRGAVAQPRLLMLRGSLEHERTSSKLSSFDLPLDQVRTPPAL